MKDLKDIVLEMTHSERLLCLCDYDRWQKTTFLESGSRLRWHVDQWLIDIRHDLIPFTVACQHLVTEIYKYYAELYLKDLHRTKLL